MDEKYIFDQFLNTKHCPFTHSLGWWQNKTVLSWIWQTHADDQRCPQQRCHRHSNYFRLPAHHQRRRRGTGTSVGDIRKSTQDTQDIQPGSSYEGAQGIGFLHQGAQERLGVYQRQLWWHMYLLGSQVSIKSAIWWSYMWRDPAEWVACRPPSILSFWFDWLAHLKCFILISAPLKSDTWL